MWRICVHPTISPREGTGESQHEEARHGDNDGTARGARSAGDARDGDGDRDRHAAAVGAGGGGGGDGDGPVTIAADATPVAAVTTDTNFDARGTATFGVDTGNGTFIVGVYGKGSNTGVVGLGNGTSGIGVDAQGGAYGVSASTTSSSGTAVFAQGGAFGVNASAFSGGGVGVRSRASGSGSYGMLATTTGVGSVACSGQATGPGSYGVYGVTAAPGQSSVYGYAVANGAAAISGVAGSAAYAGTFTGAVVVNGDFVAYGGVKSGAVPHGGDGSHRLVYCVEAAEAWLEDFGEARLVGGKAEVKLDADFAAVADGARYHVFLTGHDDTYLHVPRRSGQGFTVQADAAVAAMKGRKTADLDGTFSYRVVAKRKDIKGERLAKFVLPKTETAAPPVLKAQEPPAPPKPPQRPDGR